MGGITQIPVGTCRAWVNFNGTGTVAIRSSGNVTSITDNGVGDYTINFTNALPDVNYSVIGNSGGINSFPFCGVTAPKEGTTPTISSINIAVAYPAGGIATDNGQINVSVFR